MVDVVTQVAASCWIDMAILETAPFLNETGAPGWIRRGTHVPWSLTKVLSSYGHEKPLGIHTSWVNPF